MLAGDFHTHSTLDDGKSTLADMAAAAYQLGLPRFGFSGHSYCPWEEDFCMPKEVVGEYLSTARELQKAYAGRMDVFVGMELDLYGECPQGLDYIIGSVHGLFRNGVFYPVDESAESARRAVNEAFSGDWYQYTNAYFDLVAQLPQKTGCNWIGHFDLVSKFNQQDPAFEEESPRYWRRALEVLETLSQQGMCLELNTGAILRKYRTVPYPTERFLRRWKEFGGEIILNSDAHHISHLCGSFSEAKKLVKEIGFTHINIWGKNGFQAIGLE